MSPIDHPPTARPSILFFNRSYWPDVEATGQLLAELCSDLSREFDVRVVAGVPNLASSDLAYSRPGLYAINGVEVVRVNSRAFCKTSLVSRAKGLLSYFLRSAAVAARGPRPDVVVAETDPPFLLVLGAALKVWHGCRYICYLQDLHPEVGLALGKFRPGAVTWLLRVATQFGLSWADAVVVLGEDMRQKVLARGVPSERIRVIPNWADTDLLQAGSTANDFRRSWGTGEKLVVMYSGNIGLSQNLDQVLDAAKLLEGEPVEFLIAGDGAHKAKIAGRIRDEAIANVRLLPYQPKSRLGDALRAADVHLITLKRGLSGYIVPSKLYGILAVGRPYIAAVDAGGDIAAITDEHDCGIRVEPDSAPQLAEAVRWCLGNRRELAAMGERGRAAAESGYSRDVSTGAFADLAREMCREVPSRYYPNRSAESNVGLIHAPH